MILNERCMQILAILNEKNRYNLKQLSEYFNVHTRTIRYDIDNLNLILESYGINSIKKDNHGVFIVNLNSTDFKKIRDDFGMIFSESRELYIKLKLFSEEIVNLTKETKNLDASRSTLRKDLLNIKKDFQNKNICIQDLSSKGIKLSGDEESILLAFQNEIYKIIKSRYSGLPNILKEAINKIIGDIEPNLLKDKIEKFYKKSFNAFEHDHIFCKIVSIYSRQKLHKDSYGKNLNKAIENILKNNNEDTLLAEVSPFNNSRSVQFAQNVSELKQNLSFFLSELHLQDIQNTLEKFIDDFKEITEDFTVLEKIYCTDLYANFYNRLNCHSSSERQIKSLFYILYNYFLSKNYNFFSNLNVLFVSDRSEPIRDLVLNKLQHILGFEKIQVCPLHSFEIFGVKEKYDLTITNKDLGDIPANSIYKIDNFPLEENFVDLKFFILNNLGGKR